MNRAGLLVTLVLALVIGLIFGLWPELDLKLVAPFYDPERNGFWRSWTAPFPQLRNAAIWLITLIVLPGVAALFLKLVRPRKPLLIPGRAIVLMLTTLVLVPGLFANVLLKEYWGRPRPIDVGEYRGAEHFRPWWDPRGDCPRNCSFVGGDASGAFWTLAPAVVVPPAWRMLAVGAALAFGTAVGVLRMAAGAHFFSDVAFAGILAFLVIWLTHGLIYRWRTRISDEDVERAIERLTGRRPS
jgi:lipid A 4'-phosphatase